MDLFLKLVGGWWPSIWLSGMYSNHSASKINNDCFTERIKPQSAFSQAEPDYIFTGG
jgi:hypothetical protein